MWYPTHDEATIIDRNLLSIEKDFVVESNVTQFLTDACKRIRDLVISPHIPQTIALTFLNIANQYRLDHTENPEAAKISGTALVYLQENIPNLFGDEKCLEKLRWVSDSTLSRIDKIVNAEKIHPNLNHAELSSIEEKWRSFIENDSVEPSRIISDVNPYLRSLSDISSDFYFPILRDQVRDLLSLVNDNSKEGLYARAALRYLCLDDDAINDNIGYVGLLDDIYIINHAHALITGQSDWSPLLYQFQQKWSFIEKINIKENNIESKLFPVLANGLRCKHAVFN